MNFNQIEDYYDKENNIFSIHFEYAVEATDHLNYPKLNKKY